MESFENNIDLWGEIGWMQGYDALDLFSDEMGIFISRWKEGVPAMRIQMAVLGHGASNVKKQFFQDRILKALVVFFNKRLSGTFTMTFDEDGCTVHMYGTDKHEQRICTGGILFAALMFLMTQTTEIHARRFQHQGDQFYGISEEIRCTNGDVMDSWDHITKTLERIKSRVDFSDSPELPELPEMPEMPNYLCDIFPIGNKPICTLT